MNGAHVDTLRRMIRRRGLEEAATDPDIEAKLRELTRLSELPHPQMPADVATADVDKATAKLAALCDSGLHAPKTLMLASPSLVLGGTSVGRRSKRSTTSTNTVRAALRFIWLCPFRSAVGDSPLIVDVWHARCRVSAVCGNS